MNLSQLECFVSLAGTLNFVKTADQLGLSQPAVSRQIKSLEDELGETLFYRTSRTVTLTPIGQQFLYDAQDMLRILYRSKENIHSYHQNRSNILRIGYADAHVLPMITDAVKRLGPGSSLHPELTEDQTDANLARLQKGQLDLVVGMLDAHFQDPAIRFQKIHEDHFICVVSKYHPLAASSQEVSTADLWPHRQILAIPPYLLKGNYARGNRIVPVNDALDNLICRNSNEAYALAAAGLGYALIPEHLALPHPDLCLFPWKGSPHHAFGVYYAAAAGKDALSIRFMRLLMND